MIFRPTYDPVVAPVFDPLADERVGEGEVGGVWTPDAQDAALWFRGDLGVTTVSGVVSAWADMSGNGRDLSQGTAGLRPTPANIGLPCIYFGSGGTITYLEGAALSGAGYTAGHVFVAMALDADPPAIGGGGFWSITTDAGNDANVPFTDGVVYDYCLSSARKTTVNPTTNMVDLCLYEVVSTSAEWTNKLNGAQLFTTATNTVGWPTGTWRFGASRTTPFMQGLVYEFIVYSSKRSAAQLAELYAYFENRYGMALP